MTTVTKVKEIIADALYLELEQVTDDSRLMADLGAESIDFLDIIFRLEQEFDIKLPKGEAEKQARAGISDEEFAISGVLQEKGLERLRKLMPEIDPAHIAAGIQEKDIPTLYTVSSFVRMVEEKLAEQASEPLPITKVAASLKSVSRI
jgi:acyl carrier protein